MNRVLFVCTVPTDKSGIPNVVFNLLSNFDICEYEIGYVSINDPAELYKEKLKQKNANLYVIPRTLTNPVEYISKLSKIARNYDIIHVHGNSSTMVLEMIAAKIAGIKVRIAHSHNTSCKFKFVDTFTRPLFYKLCNVRLACGTEAGKWLFKNHDFEIINNGINVEKYKFNYSVREKLRTKLGFNHKYVIGHVGNFVEQKNHSFLIDIFNSLVAIHPNSKLLLLGDGPLKDSIQSKVNNLGLTDNVIFVGSVDDPENYLNAVDVIVMPSLFEGLPLTLIEEQANGLHAIVSDTITPDVNITGNIEFLPLTQDAGTWARTIDSWRNKGVIRTKEFSEKCILSLKEAGFDIKTTSKRLLDLYRHYMGMTVETHNSTLINRKKT